MCSISRWRVEAGNGVRVFREYAQRINFAIQGDGYNNHKKNKLTLSIIPNRVEKQNAEVHYLCNILLWYWFKNMTKIKPEISDFAVEKKIGKKFQISILNWFASNGRCLPWRNINEPFKILVAEFLLQKTDVEKVIPVYKKFIYRWPSPQSLSKARISSVSKIIQPLGLRYKTNRLKLTAKAIVKKFGGKIPEAENKLLELPGVGRYIASAVECFAFNKPRAVLDTNVIRILNRVFGIQSDKNRPRDDPCLWDFAQTLVPTNNAKQYNWGLLDYGALVCRSKEPLCGECVIYNNCRFYKKKNYDKNKL